MTAVDYESPNVLAHGRWVPVPGNRLVRRWQPAAATQPAHWHVPCPFCGALLGDECRESGGGVAKKPHSRRLEAYRQQQTTSSQSPTTASTREDA